MNNNLITSIIGNVKEQTMSSTTIAKLTGKNHADVMRDIRKMFADLDDTGAQSRSALGYYKDKNGQQRPKYALNYEQTMCLLTGYSAILRMSVIQKWKELENKANNIVISNELPIVTTDNLTIAANLFTSVHKAALSLGLTLHCTNEVTGKLVSQQTNVDLLTMFNYNETMLNNNLKTVYSPLVLDYSIDDVDQDVEEGKLWIGTNETYTPTELGLLLEPNQSGAKFNKSLEAMGLQVRTNNKWELTKKGKTYGQLENTSVNGITRKSIRWFETVVDLI